VGHFATGNGFAEGDRVDEVVLEDAGVSTDAGNVVRVVLLAEITIFIGDV
jgi:hypothetical protein